MFGDEFVLEHVIRGFLLFLLLLYQVFYCYLGGTGRVLSLYRVKGHAGLAGVINLTCFKHGQDLGVWIVTVYTWQFFVRALLGLGEIHGFCRKNFSTI